MISGIDSEIVHTLKVRMQLKALLDWLLFTHLLWMFFKVYLLWLLHLWIQQHIYAAKLSYLLCFRKRMSCFILV